MKSLFLFLAFPYLQAVVSQSLICGDCTTLDDVFDDWRRTKLVLGESNAYEPPSAQNMKDYQTIVEEILEVNSCEDVSLLSLEQKYAIELFTDAGVSYCVLATMSPLYPWGTVVVNHSGSGKALSIDSVHPSADLETDNQALAVFKGTSALSLIVSGAHRYSSDTMSTCDGDKYYISDAAHAINTFQSAAAAVLNHWDDADYTSIGFHGFREEQCPGVDAYLTHGSNNFPTSPDDKIVILRNELSLLTDGSFVVPGETLTCFMSGGTNVQGRMINGVNFFDACTVPASSNSRRFIHLEQVPRLRQVSMHETWIAAINRAYAIFSPTSPAVVDQTSPTLPSAAPVALPTPRVPPSVLPSISPVSSPTVQSLEEPTAGLTTTNTPHQVPSLAPVASPIVQSVEEPVGATGTNAPAAGTASPVNQQFTPPFPASEPSVTVTAAEQGDGCFSSLNTVQLEDGTTVAIDEVSIGDSVLVNDGSYATIYSFGHRNTERAATFVRLESTNSAIELTDNHLVLAQGSFMPASLVELGDTLSNGETVVKIEMVSRQGLYAPFTTAGTIVVSGVHCSSYISLQSHSATFKIGSYDTHVGWHGISHTFEIPHRFFAWLGETYDDDGVSHWVSLPKKTAKWLLSMRLSFLKAGAWSAVQAILKFLSSAKGSRFSWCFAFWIIPILLLIIQFAPPQLATSSAKRIKFAEKRASSRCVQVRYPISSM